MAQKQHVISTYLLQSSINHPWSTYNGDVLILSDFHIPPILRGWLSDSSDHCCSSNYDLLSSLSELSDPFELSVEWISCWRKMLMEDGIYGIIWVIVIHLKMLCKMMRACWIGQMSSLSWYHFMKAAPQRLKQCYLSFSIPLGVLY